MHTQDADTGTVTLTNTKPYPFNNSLTTAAFESPMDSCCYTVITEVTESSGEAGEIIVFGKAKNGFKLAFTGSATRAVIKYSVIGGTCNDCD